MLEDLRKKTEDLVISVYKLGVASTSIEDVKLEDIEPELAQKLNDVDTRIYAISQEIEQLSTNKTSADTAVTIVSKVNKIIDETDSLDSQIMAIPRPRNRIGRPKYYERIRFIIAKIEQITKKIAALHETIGNMPPVDDEMIDEKQPQTGPGDTFDEIIPPK
ncbi:MAG: hypothetical protein H6695_01395 [Deferribacteres bacterium]|nr:hypothetical protein [candidate division KSB1 bacterium]MCB9508802.1 hypothetical protein [Deferribacteres bacterium]